MSLKGLNIPAFAVIILYPILLSLLTVMYCSKFSVGAYEITLLIVTYYICNISVGVGLHRLWSHGSYKTKKWVEFLLSVLSAATLQGPILAWVSDHTEHHMYTDTKKDPHSAKKFKNRLVGFMWSHMGWMLQMDSGKKLSRIAIARLGRNSVVMWQFRNYWKIAITMNTLVPFLLGYIAGGNLQYAISSFLFFGLGRALQQQATFCVNSIVHCDIGTNKYYYGSARDIWWMFFLLLGENWHNFHHAFANDYRNGHKWYHADVHKWIIGLMAKIGLATELVVTSELRIQAMSKIVIGRFNRDKNIKIKVAFIEKATRRIQLSAIEKLKTAEKLAHDLRDKLSNVSNNSTYILNYVENLKLSVSTIEENFVLELYNSYESLRKSALKLNISAENCLRSIA